MRAGVVSLPSCFPDAFRNMRKNRFSTSEALVRVVREKQECVSTSLCYQLG